VTWSAVCSYLKETFVCVASVLKGRESGQIRGAGLPGYSNYKTKTRGLSQERWSSEEEGGATKNNRKDQADHIAEGRKTVWGHGSRGKGRGEFEVQGVSLKKKLKTGFAGGGRTAEWAEGGGKGEPSQSTVRTEKTSNWRWFQGRDGMVAHWNSTGG